MNIHAYLASRSPVEVRQIKSKARTNNMPSRTVASCIAPPRDIQATRRYKLPTRKEVFTYSQKYGDQVQELIPTLRPLN